MTDVIEFVAALPVIAKGPRQRLLSEPKRAALQARPGEWAILKKYATPTRAGVAASEQRKAWRVHGYEFAHAAGVLYVRYVGNGTIPSRLAGRPTGDAHD